MITPEFMPILSHGAHKNPKQGACVMEYVSILAGEEFTDRPRCTHRVLAKTAMVTNDLLIDADRHLLVPLIPRLIGTADTQRFEKDQIALSRAMAEWCYASAFAGVPGGGSQMAQTYLWSVKNAHAARQATTDASCVAALGAQHTIGDTTEETAQLRVAYLTGLLDVHAYLTGHEAQELRQDQWIELAQAVGR